MNPIIRAIRLLAYCLLVLAASPSSSATKGGTKSRPMSVHLAILSGQDDCWPKIVAAYQQKQRNANLKGSDIKLFAQVPTNVAHKTYPLSFNVKVEGISAGSQCIALDVSPIIKLASGQANTTSAEVKIDNGELQSFKIYILVLDQDWQSYTALRAVVKATKVANNINAQLSEIPFELRSERQVPYTNKDIYWIQSVASSAPPYMILCGSECQKKLNEKMQVIERYTSQSLPIIVQEGDRDLNADELKQIKLNMQCKTDTQSQPIDGNKVSLTSILQQYASCIHIESESYQQTRELPTYDPTRQAFFVKVTQQPIDVKNIKVIINWPNQIPFPSDCQPVFELVDSSSLTPIKLVSTISTSIVTSSKEYTFPHHNDTKIYPNSSFTLKFDKTSSCKFAQQFGAKQPLSKFINGEQITIPATAYPTKPVLHVVFSIGQIKKVIGNYPVSNLVTAVLNALKPGAAKYAAIAIYANFDGNTRPDWLDTNISFPGDNRLNEIASKSLNSHDIVFLLDFTDTKMQEFIKRTVTTSPDLPKPLFLFIGRHALTPDLICMTKMTTEQSVVIDFYTGNELESLATHNSLIPMPTPRYQLPVNKCSNPPANGSGASTTLGVSTTSVQQIVLNWNNVNSQNQAREIESTITNLIADFLTPTGK